MRPSRVRASKMIAMDALRDGKRKMPVGGDHPAADSDAPLPEFAGRLAGIQGVSPAWSVILRTTLIGAGQGLFLAVFAVDLLKAEAAKSLVLAACGVTLLLLAGGLVASFFHPGRPERVWRAASQWRTSSWLSREAIVLRAFMGSVVLYGALQFLEAERTFVVAAGMAAAELCVALFVCTAMIYACRKFLQEWHTPLTLVNFLLLGSASGLTLSVPVAVLAYAQFAGVLALAAFIVGAAAYLGRCISLLRNARLRPKSTTAKFFRGRPDRVLRAVRWTFLLLAFPLPAWLLGWGGGSLQVFIAAFAIQFAGLLAERWLFFAEAMHP